MPEAHPGRAQHQKRLQFLKSLNADVEHRHQIDENPSAHDEELPREDLVQGGGDFQQGVMPFGQRDKSVLVGTEFFSDNTKLVPETYVLKINIKCLAFWVEIWKADFLDTRNLLCTRVINSYGHNHEGNSYGKFVRLYIYKVVCIRYIYKLLGIYT